MLLDFIFSYLYYLNKVLINSLHYFFSCCVGVMYSGEYDVCDVTLSVYPHRASLKNMPGLDSHRDQAYFQACPPLPN